MKRYRADLHCSVCAQWFATWQRDRAIAYAKVQRLLAGGEHLIDHATLQTSGPKGIQEDHEQDLVNDHLGRLYDKQRDRNRSRESASQC